MRSRQHAYIYGKGFASTEALQARFTWNRPLEPCLRGLGVGGSSAIHALTAIRGVPAESPWIQPSVLSARVDIFGRG